MFCHKVICISKSSLVSGKKHTIDAVWHGFLKNDEYKEAVINAESMITSLRESLNHLHKQKALVSGSEWGAVHPIFKEKILTQVSILHSETFGGQALMNSVGALVAPDVDSEPQFLVEYIDEVIQDVNKEITDAKETVLVFNRALLSLNETGLLYDQRSMLKDYAVIAFPDYKSFYRYILDCKDEQLAVDALKMCIDTGYVETLVTTTDDYLLGLVLNKLSNAKGVFDKVFGEDYMGFEVVARVADAFNDDEMHYISKITEMYKDYFF